MMIELIIVLTCGIMDRLRGDNRGFGSFFESFVYGILIFSLLSTPYLGLYIPFAFASLWAIGASSGWGTPMGAALNTGRVMGPKYEWWQFGILKDNAWLALTFRGAMWGSLCIPLMYFSPLFIIPMLAMSISFPLSTYLGKQYPLEEYHTSLTKWKTAELYRGWLMGIITLIMVLLC